MDFGSSRKLTNGVQGRAANSGILNDPMFLAFAPPELSTLAGVGWEVTNMRVSKKSNIYQIGLVMAAAIRRMAVVPENNWRNPPAGYNVAPADQLHHDPGPGIGVQQIPAHKMNPGPKKYSNALINLVMTCLSPAPAQRPTAAALLAEIDREGVNNGRYKNTNTLAVGAAIPAAMKEYRIQKTRPRYAVGRRF
ncbi:hypothetical protein D6C99_05526 [Aureobasidium pullulans]|nr:hypothetical protein D6C99_05526 [Aureobasidium pullulans]